MSSVERAASNGRLTITTGDSEYRPLFKIAPVYPRRAAARGIQGYVLLEFTVTSEGAVHNLYVVSPYGTTSTKF